MEFSKLFQPITIKGMEIKNRIVMPAIGLSYTFDFSLNDRHRHFYLERARGGVGLMTIGPLGIDRVGCRPFTPGLFEDAQTGPMKELLNELHNESDARIMGQLIHMGRYCPSFGSGEMPVAPSAIPSRLTGETPREMTLEDIETVKDAYASAAGRCREAGFDMVEILACTGYLISQFLSPLTNRRADRYGGAIENRMRFGLEVIQRVRETVGDDCPLGIRVAGNDFMEGGHTNRESALFAAEAEKAGVDAVNVTGGWHETNVPQLTTNVPPGVYVYLARGIKEKVGVPVFASNRLGDPYVAERALRSGACDMICWARPLITDPDLPNKVRDGRIEEIVPCIACNQRCFDSIFSGAAVGCVLNPRAGREGELQVTTAASPKRVLVAGGGPAGMQFALIAAERGHRVTLYEKEDRLGGQVNLAKAPPGKAEFGNLIESMKARMASRGVEVVLGTPLTADMVKNEGPDLLAVASGARAVEPPVPGIDLPHVVRAWDVLSGKAWDIGRNVVVVGGSATGCETALFISSLGVPDAEAFTFLMYHSAEDPSFAMDLLHRSGRRITVIDMVPRLAENVGRTARWSLIKGLRLMGVDLRPGTRLLEITEDSVVVETSGGEEIIPADTVVTASGAASVHELAEEAGAPGMEVIKIGDAVEPRRITEAVREGFEAALRI